MVNEYRGLSRVSGFPDSDSPSIYARVATAWPNAQKRREDIRVRSRVKSRRLEVTATRKTRENRKEKGEDTRNIHLEYIADAEDGICGLTRNARPERISR